MDKKLEVGWSGQTCILINSILQKFPVLNAIYYGEIKLLQGGIYNLGKVQLF